MTLSCSLYAILAATSVVLGGCATDASDEADATEDELRIKPTGVDDGNGRVIVQGVAAVPKGDVDLLDASSRRVARGTTDAPLDFVMGAQTGRFVYVATSRQGGLSASSAGPVDVVRGQAATVKLAALKVKVGTEATLGLGGPDPLAAEFSRANGRELSLTVDTRNVKATDAVLVNETQRVLVRWGLLDGQSFTTAAEGHVSTFSLQSAASRMRAKIVAAKRELPNGCTIARDEITVGAIGRGMSFAASQTTIIGVNPEVVALESRDANGGKMTYVLPCMGYALELPVGSLGGAAHETRLGRIDVDHVDVTTPTGTVEAREGVYRIESDGMGMFQDQKFKTGTGVDVPPGTYRVVVSYPANSGWKEFTQTVTAP